jgi:GDP-4-dehydro-6-deoxy-D-mannose reductase
MTRNILVTGSNGFMAKALIERFNKIGSFNVFELSREHSVWKGKPYERVDLDSEQSVKKLLGKIEFDEIYHLAGNSSVIESWHEPLNSVLYNSRMTSNIVKAIADYALKTKLIFISSSAVYARNPNPIQENDPLGPDSPYGMSKMISELELGKIKNTLILRPFFVIGPGKRGDVLSDWISQIRSFKTGQSNYLEVGDLNTIRDFISVETSADIMMRLGSSETGIFNLGSGQSYSLSEVVNVLRTASGIDFELRINTPGRIRMGDRRTVVADITKLEEVYPFGRQPTLTEQISRIYKSFEDM